MRVGFDVSALSRPHSRGVARVVAGLVGALEARGELDVVRLEPPAGARLRTWRQAELPRRVAGEGLLGVHSFTSAFPVRGPGQRVQTVHEVPWRHGVAENADLAHRLWLELGPLFAERVVCPTEHVARDVRRGVLVGAKRVRVVPWGVEARFAPDPPAGVVDELLLDRYRLGGDPIVFCPGAVRPKKNLAAVLSGVAAWKERGGERLSVVVTGGDTPSLRKDLGLAGRLGLAGWVSTLDEVEEEDLPGLLRLSALVPVLSHSEGFGLTVLEAQACGAPVLVPPESAQAEVGGDAGIQVDPGDARSVADGIGRALAERASLRADGVRRAAGFTWEAAAERVETIWRELA